VVATTLAEKGELLLVGEDLVRRPPTLNPVLALGAGGDSTRTAPSSACPLAGAERAGDAMACARRGEPSHKVGRRVQFSTCKFRVQGSGFRV